MQGMMMNFNLGITAVMRHAEQVAGDAEIVSPFADGRSSGSAASALERAPVTADRPTPTRASPQPPAVAHLPRRQVAQVVVARRQRAAC